jgi:hypothetical protein
VYAIAAEPVCFSLLRIDTKSIRTDKFQVRDAAGTLGIRPGERFFALDMGIQYSYNYTRKNFGQTLLPDLGSLYGFEDIQGYDPFIPWRYAFYMRRLNSLPAPTVTLYPSHFGLVRSTDSPWLSRFGPLKARGPLDYEWPFFPPRLVRPGERFVINLSRPWLAQPGKAVCVYAAYLLRGADGTENLLFRFFRGEQEVAPSQTAVRDPRPLSRLEALLWDNVWPPSAETTRVRRARVLIGAETSTTETAPVATGTTETERAVDRIVVECRAKTPVLLYSLGLPRAPALFPPTRDPALFESIWREDFPAKVELHRVPVIGADRRNRAAYEQWAARLAPDRVHIEIEGESPAPSAPPRVLQGWSWSEKRSNRLRVRLPQGHGGGWLVLGEPYAAGWECRVDGARTAIYAADTLFRAVPVAPGARDVVMTYFPPAFARGLLICCLTLSLIALGFMRRKTNARRGNQGSLY